MNSVFDDRKIKTSRQIKTKDQNLKKKYFTNNNTKYDLLKLAHQKIVEFVKKFKKIEGSLNENDKKMANRLKRFEATLKKCQDHE